MMKGLFINDSYALWKQVKIMLILIAGYVVIGAWNQNQVFLSLAILFSAMLPVNAFAIDERSKWDKYVIMLPCRRKEIVMEKYLLGMFASGATILLYGIFSLIFGVCKTKLGGAEAYGIQAGEVWSVILTLLAAAALMQGSNLFLLFKWGESRGRLWTIVLTGVIYGLFIAAAMIVEETGGMLPDMADIPMWQSAGILFLLSMMFWAVCLFLSIRAYEKRDL